MYDAWMEIVECRRRRAQPATWDVVGPVCESGDWLGRDRRLDVAHAVDDKALTGAAAGASD